MCGFGFAFTTVALYLPTDAYPAIWRWLGIRGQVKVRSTLAPAMGFLHWMKFAGCLKRPFMDGIGTSFVLSAKPRTHTLFTLEWCDDTIDLMQGM